MTLDEAIEYEKESLQHCKRMLEEIYEDNLENKILKFEVKQHDQLAEWLEELKDYQDKNKMVVRVDVEKLKRYRDLEEQGLLLRLPVPIGTTVYKFEPLPKGTKRYIKTTVTRYEVFDDSIWFTFANGLGRNIEDFGKFVFLTQSEAEQKLNEMESD